MASFASTPGKRFVIPSSRNAGSYAAATSGSPRVARSRSVGRTPIVLRIRRRKEEDRGACECCCSRTPRPSNDYPVFPLLITFVLKRPSVYWYFTRGLIVSAGHLILPLFSPAMTRFATAATCGFFAYFGQSFIVATDGSLRSWKIAPGRSLPWTYRLSSSETASVLFSISVPTTFGYEVQSGIVILNIGGFLPVAFPAW